MNTRILRVCLLLLLMIGLSWQSYRMWGRGRTTSTFPNPIPKEGYAENDTGGKILGDPKNGIDDLKRLYTWIVVYKNRHAGQYPAALLPDLVMDIKKSPQDYGVKSVQEVVEILKNPDSKFGDWTKKKADNVLPYSVTNKRPDGTSFSSPKKFGKDAVGICSLYQHTNIRLFPGERSTENPVGFHLVLWEDGSITRVSYADILFIPSKSNNVRTYHRAVRGQAGMPENALTYDQYHQRAGWKRGPRGSEGSKGQSYDSDRG